MEETESCRVQGILFSNFGDEVNQTFGETIRSLNVWCLHNRTYIHTDRQTYRVSENNVDKVWCFPTQKYRPQCDGSSTISSAHLFLPDIIARVQIRIVECNLKDVKPPRRSFGAASSRRTATRHCLFARCRPIDGPQDNSLLQGAWT